ncbi:MAG TPA: DNA primase [Chromatiales bacterium]|nr:DNA primase [Chromatiales bacterium]
MAGRIPESFIDELMARVDIVEVIDARVPLRKTGKEYAACCPFHDEKTASFTVSPTKQFFHCFGCGAHGSAIGFLMDYEHLDFVSCVEELASRVGMEVPREGADDSPGDSVSRSLYPLLEKISAHYQAQLRDSEHAPQAVDYLKLRGLSGEIAARFGIGFAAPGWRNVLDGFGVDQAHVDWLKLAGMVIENDQGKVYDRFRERVMFPIRDRRGRVIGFGGRVLGDDTPKYLNSPETPVFHKGRELYGLYEACLAERKLERLLVVEGYMDVVALAQAGLSAVVATLGTATTTEHLQLLFRVTPEVVFSFDGDRAGRDAAWKALLTSLPHLQAGRQIRLLMLPDGEDPDTLVRKEGADAFRARMAKATPLSEYYFAHLCADLDMQSMDGRARLVELARPHIALLPPGAFRELMLARLAEVSGLQLDKLEALLRGDKPPERATRPVRRAAQRPISSQQVMTPMRRAIAILIQNPHLSQKVGDVESLRNLPIAGIDLLLQLIEVTRNSPTLTTGGLLERWRDSEQVKHLSVLAQHDLVVSEDVLEDELAGALDSNT